MAQALRNSGGVPFLTLKGHFVVRPNQKPDGDTLAFAASKKYTARKVETNIPVNLDGQTTSNLRLQSIDAPEKTQPAGATARDQLLKYFGFDIDALGVDSEDFTAGGDLQMVAGWVATHGMDGFGRPLSYLFRKNPGFTHGEEVPASRVLAAVKSSANHAQITSGVAFPAFYNNTEESHAVLFQQAAQKARSDKKGVWKIDRTTTGFVPTEAALGPKGTLVYPKFFRRVDKWKTQKPDAAAFIDWLKRQADGRKLVAGAELRPVPLWQLFQVVDKRRVAVPYDVAKLWFSE